jgi:hypothetical protein
VQDGAHLPVPAAPGLGVELDRDRVDRYASLYRSGAGFGCHAPEALRSSPALPKF